MESLTSRNEKSHPLPRLLEADSTFALPPELEEQFDSLYNNHENQLRRKLRSVPKAAIEQREVHAMMLNTYSIGTASARGKNDNELIAMIVERMRASLLAVDDKAQGSSFYLCLSRLLRMNYKS